MKITCTFDDTTHKVVPLKPTYEMTVAAWSNDENVDGLLLMSAPVVYIDMTTSAPPYPADAGWISTDDGLPAIGQVVDLCINGTVQNETHILDACYSSDYRLVQYFWSREDDQDGIDIESDQFWKARPLPAAPKGK